MRLGKKERQALKVKRHERLAIQARQGRVEALPQSDVYTSLSQLETSLHMGKAGRWEYSVRNDREYTGKGRKL